jgi:hypothetical protein
MDILRSKLVHCQSFQLEWTNTSLLHNLYVTKCFMLQVPGIYLIKLFWYKLTHFSKLDRLIAMKPLLYTFIKWSSLQKSLIKFTLK